MVTSTTTYCGPNITRCLCSMHPYETNRFEVQGSSLYIVFPREKTIVWRANSFFRVSLFCLRAQSFSVQAFGFPNVGYPQTRMFHHFPLLNLSLCQPFFDNLKSCSSPLHITEAIHIFCWTNAQPFQRIDLDIFKSSFFPIMGWESNMVIWNIYMILYDLYTWQMVVFVVFHVFSRSNHHQMVVTIASAGQATQVGTLTHSLAWVLQESLVLNLNCCWFSVDTLNQFWDLGMGKSKPDSWVKQ